MGNAARQRRLRKEKARQQRRASQPGPQAGSRPGHAPTKHAVAAVLVGDAVQAICAGQQDAYDTCLARLADTESLDWTRAVSRSLVEFLRASVAAAWRHGWQPAELARHIGRELSDAHVSMAADMIADEMRGHAAAAVDGRWAAQVAALATLDGKGWWGSDADYLTAWQLRSGARTELGGLLGAVATAIELLHQMAHLVVLERLLPLPGTSAAATAERASARQPNDQPVDDRLLGRIRALLAKAESTEFAEEAEALSGRAQEIMAKYSIDHALLAAESGRQEEPGGRRIAVDNPYEAAKASLLQAVADANRCRVVWLKELGLVTVIGFPADLDAVELLFTSLLVQANTAMLRAGAKRDAYGRSRTRAFRQSFLVAYAYRIGERLSEAAEHAEQEAVAEQSQREPAQRAAAAGSGGTELVPLLAARHEAVDEAVDEMFGGKLTTHRTARATDAEGWDAGRAAADMASLHNRAPVTNATRA
jgi:hypothetical protein